MNDKWNVPVDVICYNDLTNFPTRLIAKNFYLECISFCEGAERDRYTNIFLDLEQTDDVMVHDGTCEYGKEPTFWSVSRYDCIDNCCKDHQKLPHEMTYNEYIKHITISKNETDLEIEKE